MYQESEKSRLYLRRDKSRGFARKCLYSLDRRRRFSSVIAPLEPSTLCLPLSDFHLHFVVSSPDVFDEATYISQLGDTKSRKRSSDKEIEKKSRRRKVLYSHTSRRGYLYYRHFLKVTRKLQHRQGKREVSIIRVTIWFPLVFHIFIIDLYFNLPE